jgi:hypothetical protein
MTGGKTMVRLIDADALDAEMYHKSFEVDDGRNVWNSGLWIRYKIFEEALRDAPTVDAVPVIRCRDCKWYEEDIGCDWGVCFHDDWTHRDVGHGVDGDGYCYRAERKEE